MEFRGKKFFGYVSKQIRYYLSCVEECTIYYKRIDKVMEKDYVIVFVWLDEILKMTNFYIYF